MKKRLMQLLFLSVVAVTVALSLWGPEAFSRYQDRKLWGAVHQVEAGLTGEGYRYVLSGNEKLFILSRALDSQKRQESGQGSANFAWIVNHRGPSETEISEEEIYERCNGGLRQLKDKGILPEEVKDVDPELYNAVLYSAIDAREPRSHVPVWKVSLSSSLRNVKKENRVMEVYLDGETGEIYQFYVRISHTWEELDPESITDAWNQYLGLSDMEAYDQGNPLTEATPYVKKYLLSGMEGEKTVVTIGFYEGIRELFLSVSPER